MCLVVRGILNGSITTALTTFTIDFDFTVYGEKVEHYKKVFTLSCV